MWSRSPTWSVYDGEWSGGPTDEPRHGLDAGSYVDCVSRVPEPLTLRGSGLKKKESLSRGAQGAVYAAYDPSLPAVPRDSPAAAGDGAEDWVPGKGRLVAVKRLFTQASDFGARGIAETVLREATLLTMVRQRQQAMPCSPLSAAAGSPYSPSSVLVGPGTMPIVLDQTARVVELHRVVEAPHQEFCLVLEHCPLDLGKIVLDTGRRSKKAELGMVLRASSGPPREGDARGDEGNKESGGATAAPGPTTSTTDGLSGSLPLCVVRYLLRRILRMVCFLHESCHILHRDLKLSNVLVTSDGDLRLSDFGSACFTRGRAAAPKVETAERTGSGGAYTPAAVRTTRLYQSPECLLGSQSYGPPMEVWAIGVIFAELLRRTHLLAGESELSLLSAIWKLLGPPPARTGVPVAAAAAPDQPAHALESNSGSDVPPAVAATDADSSTAHAPPVQATLPFKFPPSVVPPAGYDLLRRMLTIAPEQRITVREALAHPFLSDPDDSPSGAADSEEGDDREGQERWRGLVHAAIRASQAKVTVLMPSLQVGRRAPHGGLALDEDDDDEDEDGGVVGGRTALLASGMRVPLGVGLSLSGEGSDEEEEEENRRAGGAFGAADPRLGSTASGSGDRPPTLRLNLQ